MFKTATKFLSSCKVVWQRWSWKILSDSVANISKSLRINFYHYRYCRSYDKKCDVFLCPAV